MEGRAVTDTLRPGTMLSGSLRIERVIGQGSMGIVFEATDLALRRAVAIKLMSPDRANNAEARKRFLREARAAVQLSSEHVTRLFDVGELPDGTPYLVMEHLVGATLAQLLTRDGVPAIDVAVDWTLQALEGLAEAHHAGFVHRDLKPENLFLCESPDRPPVVKVLDFGTVKDLVTKSTQLTRTGSTMGSPAYMPPEQIRADTIDQRADVWAMGVTLYELLTGELPFAGETIALALAAILRDSPTPLRQRRPDAPPELEAVITCALTKDPAGRYASASELLSALGAVRARMPRTSNMTRTIHLSPNQPMRARTPDPFADTTDMRRFDAAHDSSRVRARIAAPVRVEHPTLVDPSAPAPEKTRSHIWLFVFATIVALTVGATGGAIVSRRRPVAPAPSGSTSAHAPAAPPAGVPSKP